MPLFFMFMDCASYALVAPPTSDIRFWLKNHIFTFSTTSLKDNDGLKLIVTVIFQV